MRVDHHRIQKMNGQAVEVYLPTRSPTSAVCCTPTSRRQSPSVAPGPGTSLALLVPLGHPVSRAQRAIVLGILLALFIIFALLRFAPETMKKRGEERAGERYLLAEFWQPTTTNVVLWAWRRRPCGGKGTHLWNSL